MIRPATRWRDRGDEGFTILELVVTSVLLILILTMTMLTMSIVSTETSRQTQATTGAINAETSMWTLRQWVQNIVTPYTESVAKNTAVTANSPCWGLAPPSFYPSYNGNGGGGALYGAVYSQSGVNPANNAILVAHDFDMVFCAHPAGTRAAVGVANIYRLWINPSTCINHGATQGGGCKLELDNFGPSPACTYGGNPGPTSLSTCFSPTSTQVTVIQNVWCNLSCQEDVNGTLGAGPLTEPPLFTYYTDAASTTPVTTPADDTSLAGGASIYSIHSVGISLTILRRTAVRFATTQNSGSTAYERIFLASTITAGSFSYTAIPTITNVTPTTGPIAGGTTVTITGSNLSDTTSVTVGGAAATLTSAGSASISFITPVCTAPGCTAGTALNIEVTASGVPVDSDTATPTPFYFTYTGAPVSLEFLVQPPAQGISGQALTPSFSVAVVDGNNNPVTSGNGSTDVIQLNFSGPTGGTNSGLTAQADNGVAQFLTTTLSLVGMYTFTAVDTTNTSVNSAPATVSTQITFGNPAQLVFTPSTPTCTLAAPCTAGTPITPSFTVSVEDAYGNLISSGNGSTDIITLNILSGTGPREALISTNSAAAVGGVATLSPTLSLVTTNSTPYTLTASDTTTTGVATTNYTPIYVTHTTGSANKLYFTTEPPATGVRNAALSPFTVAVEDQFGNVITGSTDAIKLSATGPGALTAGGLASATAGVATFSSTTVNAYGSYTFTATDQTTVLATDTSTPPTVVGFGAPSKLAFTTQPPTGTAGSNLSPSFAVSVEDVAGNLITSGTGSTDTVALSPNSVTLPPGPAGSVTGGSVAAVGGVATFGGATGAFTALSLAGNFTLTASDSSRTGITTNTSSSFSVSPAISSISPNSDPINTASPITITGAGFVTGNTSVKFTNGGQTFNVTPTVVSSTSLTLSTPLWVTPGAVTVTVTVLGSYTSSGLPFTFFGPPSKLAFATQPPSGNAGANLGTFTVAVEDAFGNIVTSGTGATDAISLSVASGPAGTVTGNTATAAAGVATFAATQLNLAGNYTLAAADTSRALITPAASGSFTIIPTVTGMSPSSGLASVATTVTITGTGFVGGSTTVFFGGTAATPVTVASSTSLSVPTTIGHLDGKFNVYVTVNGLAAAATPQFTFIGTPDHLIYTAEPPPTGTAGSALTTFTVAVVDSAGDIIPSGGGSADSIALTVGTGPAGGAINAGATATGVAGVSTFNATVIDKAGSYTLTATDSSRALPGGQTVTSSPATVIGAAAASKLVFTTEPPATGAAGTALNTFAVSVEDQYGNVITAVGAGANDVINLTATSVPAGGTIASGASATAVNGVATFNATTINTAGSYTLIATDASRTLPTASSAPPTVIAAGPPATVVVSSAPFANVVASASATQAFTLRLQDAFGNAVTWTSPVTIGLHSTSAGAKFATASGGAAVTSLTLPTGTSTVAGFYGDTVAGTPTISLSPTTTGLTLTGGTQTESIIPAAASKLAFTTEPPSNGGAGTALTTFAVSVEDPFGNVVTTGTGSTDGISLSVATGPAGGVIASGATAIAVNGVASFSQTVLDTLGSYTLSAGDPSHPLYTTATSTPVAIGAGTVSKLVISSAAFSTPASTSPTQAFTVGLEDAFNNPTDTATALTVTLNSTSAGALFAATSGGTATTSVTIPALGTSVSAFYSDTKSGNPTVTASSSPLTSGSQLETVTALAASQVVFSIEPPAAGVVGTALTTFNAKVEDPFGNVIATGAGSTDTVNLTIVSGPTGGAIASGGSVTAVAGLATFNSAVISVPGTYTLGASDGSRTLTTATASAPTVVNPAAAAKVVFTTEPPATGTAGTTLSGFVAKVEDAFGNVITTGNGSADTITLTVATGPTGGAIASGNTAAAVGGVANFGSTLINVAGSYTLTATDSTRALTTATSTPPTVISPGPASMLAFSPPAFTVQAATSPTQPFTVSLEDAHGNPTTVGTALTIGLTSTSAGAKFAAVSAGATVTSVTLPANTPSVVAFYSDTNSGTPTLTAATPGYTSGTQKETITPDAATKLAFATTPGTTASGSVLAPQPVVDIEDASGNLVTGSTAAVTMAIGTGSPAGSLSGCTETTTAGVATFTGCKITGPAGNYTLTASSTGLTAATSTSFAITAGPAAKLALVASPGSTANGVAFTAQPVFDIEDASGNIVTTSTATVTLTVAAGSPAGTLSGCTETTTAGVASFSGCLISGLTGNYTLTGSSAGLTSANTAAFAITAGAAAKLALVTSPGSTANGVAFTAQPKFDIEDSGGNIVTTSTAAVTVAVATGSPAGTVSGCGETTTAGVATFTGCKIIGPTGSYVLTASSAGLTSVNTAAFAITVGAATQVGFAVTPSTTASGTVFTTQPKVDIEDSGGNTVTTSTATVTLAIAAGSPAGTLSGCTETTTAGVATFTLCKITGTAGSYTLTASSTGLASGNSAAFSITAGTATKLALVASPGSTANGVAFTAQPQFAIEDANGNIVTTSVAAVTLAIATGSPAGTLSGCTETTTAGVATFTGCLITGPTGTYTLTASSTGLTGVNTASFPITVGAAAKLALVTSPGTTANGVVFTAQPKFDVEDSGGNLVTTSTATVALTIAAGSPAGALSGCTETTTAGVATFSGCLIIGPIGTYTLTAASAGLTSVNTAGFAITVGTAFKVAVTTPPSTTANGSVFATQPKATIEDSGGNTITTSTATVTLAIATGSPAGTLSGCTETTTAGVATFTGCKITGTAGSYMLTASSTGLASGNSAAFSITAGPATKLALVASPASSANGAALAPQPVFNVEDASGNIVTTSAATVTLAITAGSPAGTLSGCTETTTAGVATFTGCLITGPTGTYTLTASSTGLTGVNTASFAITVGAPAKLVLVASPSTTANGVAFATQPKFDITDSGGNLETTSTAAVTLAVATGSPAGTVTGCSETTTAGVATFSGCSIVGTIGSYTLTASSTGLTSVNTAAFTITVGAATQVAFATSPSNTANGSAFGTQPKVNVEDSGGNVVTLSLATVTLSIATGSPAGTLSGCVGVALLGVTTFTGCTITGTAGSYTLTASSTGLASGNSAAFSITAGPATKLALVASPASSANGAALAPQPVFNVEDASGNIVTTSAATVTLAITAGSPAGTLSGCTETTTAGVATFSGCLITGPIGTYTLTASSTGLTGVNTASFPITLGAPAKLVLVTSPASTVNGTVFATQPKFDITDSGGNLETASTATVTLAIATGSPAGILSGCSETTTAGVAAFSGCLITGTAGNYTLTASSAGLTSVNTAAFAITAGSANKLFVATTPGTTANGAVFTAQPVVDIEDGSGNIVTGSSATVTLALATGSPAGTLSGCTETTTAGVATFSACKITGTAGSYTLTASSTGLSSANSGAFSITAGPATQVVLVTSPGPSANGAALAPQPLFNIEDASGNVVTTSAATVSLAIAAGSPAGTLSGCTETTTAGVATFSGCLITGPTGTYTLTASSTGLTSVNTASFALTMGAATKLVLVASPGSTANGVAFTTQPKFNIEDSGNNLVTTSSATVALAIAAGSPAGTLSGCTETTTAGVATFSGCLITGPTGTYTLTASSTGLTSVNTASFALTVGAPAKLALVTSPGSTANGVAFTAQPKFDLLDSGGNQTTSTAAVTLAVATGSPAGTVSGCSETTTAGVATFTGCSIIGPTGTYTLTASSTGLTSVNTASFAITVGAAKQVAVVTTPSTTASGSVFGTQAKVDIEDSGGNIVTTSGATVTLAIAAGSPAGTLSGCTETTTAGVASFTGCLITGTAGSYTLTASSTGLTSANSAPFSITAGVATKLALVTSPGTTPNGVAFTAQPVFAVEDASNNVVTTSSATVTLSITAGSPAGTLSGCTETTTAGIATFSGCLITGTTGTYTLTAASTGLTSVNTAGFALTVGTATKLALVTSPGSTANGVAFTAQPKFDIVDSGNNLVTTSSATVALTVAAGSPAGTLTGCSETTTAGVATFSGCSIVGPTGTYTLTASSAGLTSVNTAGFAITVGAATQLFVATTPGTTANGTVFGTQPKVDIEDSGGNIVTTSGATVTLAIAVGSPAGTLAGCAETTTAGVATFTGCKITGTAGSYILTASSTGLASANSAAFSVTAGTPTQLVLVRSPGSTANGVVFTSQPVFNIEDASGNLVLTSSATVTLSIAAGSPAGTLSGCSETTTAGVATFSGCLITGTAGSYTLTAASTGLTSANTGAFAITLGTATKLVLVTSPGSTANGAVFSAQPTFDITDSGGNVETGSSATVALAIAAGSPAGTLSGCSETTTAGVASFSGCFITGTVGTYTLTASSAGLTSVNTVSFALTPGGASQLALVTSPGSTANGVVFTAQPVFDIEDASGNVVTTSSAAVTLAIAAGSPAGTLSGCSETTTTGVATFSGCKIVGPIGSYTLTASSVGLTSANTASFTLTVGAATQLVLANSPGSTANGVAFGNQPKFDLEDSGGNLTTSTATVTLAIAAGSPAGTLSGCSETTTAGVATFSGCLIIGPTGTYTLTASSAGLTSVNTLSFPITVGAANKVVVAVSPGTTASGTLLSPQPKFDITDSGGNLVTTSSAAVTLAITAGSPAGTLSGCGETTTGGVATFTGCIVTGVTGSYTLTASSTGLTSGNTASFALTAGAAAKVVVATSPTSTANGAVFSPQPTFDIEDISGNLVTTSSAAVTLAIAAGSPAGTLSGCGETTTGGVATFTGCLITGPVGTYALTASSTGLTSGNTASFSITPGGATKLAIIASPGSTANGVAFTTQAKFDIEDASNNLVTTSAAPVTLAIAAGSPAGTLSGCSEVTTAGVATFSGCLITGPIGTYTLTGSSTGLTSANTASFTITVGAAAQLALVTSPGTTANGVVFTGQPKFDVLDSGGNQTASTATVTLAIAGGSPAGTLSGCSEVTASGVATFSGCLIIGPAGTYTLTATSAGLTSVNTAGFSITVGAATQVVAVASPGTTANATVFGTQPKFDIEDSGGNLESGSSAAVTLSVAAGSPTGVLSGCSEITTGGVATFTGCLITGTAGLYTLTGASTGLASGNTGSFTLTAGTATKLVLVSGPGTTANGVVFTAQPKFNIEDASNNIVTTSSASVSLAIAVGSPAGTLSGCSETTTAGVATFSGCLITGPTGATYALTASSAGLASANTGSFSITLGAAAKVVVATSPSNTASAVVFGTQPKFDIEDSGGNIETGSTATVTLAIAAGMPAGTLSGCGETTTGGVATFTGCLITGTVGTYALTASSAGLVSGNTATLSITAGAANKWAITSAPFTVTAGTTANQAFTITLEDSFGNPTTVGTATTVTLAANPAGGAKFATSSGGAGVTTTSLPANTSSVTAYFADSVAGNLLTTTSSNPVITASGTYTAGTQTETVNSGTATQLAITSTAFTLAASATPVVSAPFTVTLHDANGNAVAAGATATTVNLTSTGGTGKFGTVPGSAYVTSVTIPTGATQVTAYFGDTTAGTRTITATSTLPITLTQATQAEAISANTGGYHLTISGTTTTTLTASTSPAAADELNVVCSSSACGTYTVNLTSTSPRGFFTSTNGGGACQTTLITTVTVTSNTVSHVCYGDSLAGNGTTLTQSQPILTASVAGAGASAGTVTMTVNSGTASQLSITTAPVTTVAAASPGAVNAVIVTLQDAEGNATKPAATVTVNLTAATGGYFTVWNNGTGCTTTLASSVTIATTATQTEFCFGSTAAGMAVPTITVAATGLSGDTANVTVTGSPANKLAITSSPFTIWPGASATQAFTVTLEDSFGNPTTSGTATTVGLGSTSGGAIFATTYNGTSATTVSLPANTQEVTAFYGDSVTGSPTITASSAGLTSGTQPETVG